MQMYYIDVGTNESEEVHVAHPYYMYMFVLSADAEQIDL